MTLSPAYLRPESEPGYQKIAWQPTWKCFCCQDSGFVRLHLIKAVIESYDPQTQKPVKCNASDCEYKFGEHLIESDTLDDRFPSSICDRFDREERQVWKEWSQEKHELRKQKLALVEDGNITRNLRSRSRLRSEEFEAQRKHRDVANS